MALKDIAKNFLGFSSSDKGIVVPNPEQDTTSNYSQHFLNAQSALCVDPLKVDRKDNYVSYTYAAVNAYANRLAELGMNHLHTALAKDIREPIEVTHPYLELIAKSKDFSDVEFWKTIGTHLRLSGEAFIYVNRGGIGGTKQEPTRFTKPHYFEVLSPYEVVPIFDPNAPMKRKNVTGYIEVSVDSQGKPWKREFFNWEIIHLRHVNPNSDVNGFGVVTAAKAAIYQHLEGMRFTRISMNNALGAPGIITTKNRLETDQWEKFQQDFNARYSGTKNGGKPILANGAEAIGYEDISQDLDKLSLKETQELAREMIMVSTGTNMVTLGLGEDVNRATAETMRDAFAQDHVEPGLQDILSTLNQDYRNKYPVGIGTGRKNRKPYEGHRDLRVWYTTSVSANHEAEKMKFEATEAQVKVAVAHYRMGVNREVAYKMAGITLPEDTLIFDHEPILLGSANSVQEPGVLLPTAQDQQNSIDDDVDDVEDPENPHEDVPEHENTESLEHPNKIDPNAIPKKIAEVILSEREKLKEEVQEWHQELMDLKIKQFKDQTEETEKNALFTDEETAVRDRLGASLLAFNKRLAPEFAAAVGVQRLKQFGLNTEFELTKKVLDRLKTRASLAATSHLVTGSEQIAAIIADAQSQGFSTAKTTRLIRDEFGEKLSPVMATSVARTETNVAYSTAQYSYDEQFIKEHNLTKTAFKKWVTNSGNPCPYCLQAEANNTKVPFDSAFYEVGDSLSANFPTKKGLSSRTYTVSFQDVTDGNLHVNCSCSYELVIEGVANNNLMEVKE